ncbi:hypothetical protein CF327_g210 [Tilletia walkeri]|nr:hypothetical protein CF327_g210 [Tilletia walkeri]
MDHTVVQRWLRQVLSGPYAPNADRVYIDIDRVLIAFSSLSPRTEVYTHDDGRSQLLLELTGTIPIQYKGNTYHIPVSFWIPHGYPREPPIVYVTPTTTMLVRKGKHVDPNGRVSVDYLDVWSRKPEACNLIDLIHACREIFSQQPPVYAKPPPSAATTAGPSSQAASTSQSSQQPQRQPPPLPPATTPSHSQQPHPQSQPQPPPPPLPSSVNAAASPTLPSSQPGGGGGPPPRPPPPPGQFHRASPIPAPAQTFTPPPPPSNHAPPPRPPPPPVRASLLDDDDAGGRRFSPVSGSTHLPPGGQEQQQQAHPAPGPAPPRPLNPELLNLHSNLHTRLSTTLTSLSTALSTSNSQLAVLVSDLERGGEAIQDERVRLEAVRDVCWGRAGRVGEVLEGAGRWRGDVEGREGGREDVDRFVVATSLVGNQLLTLVAEDHALEDTLYQLGRALNAERIDLDRFLKQTRHLAREQFMRRALARKISEGMGWPAE